jgi:hypothetical protein
LQSFANANGQPKRDGNCHCDGYRHGHSYGYGYGYRHVNG